MTTRITRVENEPFKTEGKVMINPGWQVVYGREVQARGAEDESALIKLNPGEGVLAEEIKVISSQTPPSSPIQ